MQIVVRQISGLGNQLFQYAAGRYYARRYGATMRIAADPAKKAFSNGIPRPFLLSHFSISAPVSELGKLEALLLSTRPQLEPLRTLLAGTMGVQVAREEIPERYTFLEDLPVEAGVRSVYLVGYWQTHKIADALGMELRAEFAFRQPATGKNLEVLEQIRSSRNPVSLHVRRGDYTLISEGNLALPMGYYNRAIARIREQIADPTFFVFSDDIEFARANLLPNSNAVFVDHNHDATAHEDLRLMSHCHHHIIANSTFSWWAAWLNPHADKIVLAPKQWHLRSETYHPELMPPSWELLDVQG
jgi:hypothetical protein